MSGGGTFGKFFDSKAFLAVSIIILIVGFGLLGIFYYNILQMSTNQQNIPSQGSNIQDLTQLEEYLANLPIKELNDTELKGILYMREEEKLARDVYLELYDLWGSQIFSNIAHSEQIHMDAVLLLINRYNLTDPIVNDTRGSFNNTHLQELYNELTTNGSKSLEDAYKVGALIEEVDIIDLEEYISKTDNDDIITVYEFLERGSYNHLRAFVKQLSKLGVTYTPVLLSQEQYNEIISSTTGPGMETTGISAMQVINMYYFYVGIASIAIGIVFIVLYFTTKSSIKRETAQVQ